MTSASRIAENKKLFRSFRKGDSGALVELLENERSGLYDYLLRMTGQVQKSCDTIEEVFLSLNDGLLSEMQTFEDLRLLLYTTARKFNADIWNANTALLENAAIGEHLRGQPLDEDALLDVKFQQDLDRGLRGLKPFDREVAYLRLVVGLALSDIADSLGNPLHAVEAAYDAAMSALERETQRSREDVEDGLHRITRHPVPPRSSHATVNLSMVMEGIKTRPSGVWSVRRIILVVIVIVVAGLWYFVPDVFAPIFSMFRSLTGGDR